MRRGKLEYAMTPENLELKRVTVRPREKFDIMTWRKCLFQKSLSVHEIEACEQI